MYNAGGNYEFKHAEADPCESEQLSRTEHNHVEGLCARQSTVHSNIVCIRGKAAEPTATVGVSTSVTHPDSLNSSVKLRKVILYESFFSSSGETAALSDVCRVSAVFFATVLFKDSSDRM